MNRKLQKQISRSVQCALLALMLAFPFVCHAGWQLVWSDEFNKPDGSSPASTNWTYDVGNGNGGWGNNQLEYDTGRTNNARIQGGQLVIEARQENTNGFNYTSARMKTQGKWSWTYGRIEASIKLPKGQGIWPAFWMLGANIDSVGWPTCGEIDIMENIGNAGDQGTDHGTIHGPQSGLPANCGGDYNCYSGVSGTYTMPGGGRLSDGFHIFAIEWTTNQIKWFCDTNLFFTATPTNLPSGGTWVFTAPQFLILNLAIGGNWPGNPDGTTVFPQQMLVDYVRVYNYVPAPPDVPTGLTASPGNAKVYLSWDASNSGATGYVIRRAAVSSGAYVTIGTTSSNSFTDSGVANCSTYYYVVSATNSLGQSNNSSEQTASLGAFALAVNSGGSAVGQFVADAYFSGGTQAAPTTAAIDTSGLFAPAPQAVYQTERYGNHTYTFTGLTSGLNYRVRLHLCEYYWTSVGQRRFNVSINGTKVLSNFDILAVTGVQNKATIQEFTATATNGQITVQFTGVTDNAKSGGIEILLPRAATPTAGNNSPIWMGMNLNLTASTVPGATYNWTGPNGFTSTNQNPTILNASTNASGLYTLTAVSANCSSTPATTLVSVNPPARLTIQSSGETLTIDWPAGMLQSATNISGPWINLSVATPLTTNVPAMEQQFYRVKLQ